MNIEGDFEGLIENYVRWLKDKTLTKKLKEDTVEITTPFLDRHNDYLQIYAKKFDNFYRLSDDGHTLSDLAMSGCELQTPKRKRLLDEALNGLGVKLLGENIYVDTTPLDFPQKKHDLIQAILAVNDLFYLAQSTVSSLFMEDVTAWFDSLDIRYVNRARFTGKSGFSHSFDYVIPKSAAAPERVIQLMNRPSRSTAEKFAFTWVDTKVSRDPGVKAYAFLNDKSDKSNMNEIAAALRSYDLTPILWSQKEEFREALTA
ncbi:MAG: DUF1828 domain-containing protein [Proteobacteria bacterium]|nr:MAG: DUF1828 domain-containing protein [Pseudomonadota bacterium]